MEVCQLHEKFTEMEQAHHSIYATEAVCKPCNVSKEMCVQLLGLEKPHPQKHAIKISVTKGQAVGGMGNMDKEYQGSQRRQRVLGVNSITCGNFFTSAHCTMHMPSVYRVTSTNDMFSNSFHLDSERSLLFFRSAKLLATTSALFRGIDPRCRNHRRGFGVK